MSELGYTLDQCLEYDIIALMGALEACSEKEIRLHEVIWRANGGKEPLYKVHGNKSYGSLGNKKSLATKWSNFKESFNKDREKRLGQTNLPKKDK
jgi:hypothetical protein